MKFSIITAVLNDNKNIEKTILSVKNQTHRNKEHIIIDGKSSDGTWEIIKKYSKTVRHFRKKDKSLYDAINTGIKMSKGDIIFLIHSGDIFTDKDILKKVNVIFNKNFEVVSGDVAFYDNKKSITRNWTIKTKTLNNQNFYKIPHTSLFIKKKIIQRLKKYSLKYKISSDLDFLIKLSKLKKNFFYFNQHIVFMKTGGLSTSKNNIYIKIKEDLKILSKYYGILFIFIYLKKILIKFPSFLKINKKFLNIKLKNQFNLINEK